MQPSWKIVILSISVILQTLYVPSQCQSGDGPDFRSFSSGSIFTDTDMDEITDEPYVITGSVPVDFVTEKNLDDLYLDLEDKVEKSETDGVREVGRTGIKILDNEAKIERTKETTVIVVPVKGIDENKFTTGTATSGFGKETDQEDTTAAGTETGTVTEANADEGKAGLKSSKSTIILVVIGVFVLIGTCCVWRYIQLRKKRAARSRRRNMENHSKKSPVEVEWQSRGDIIRVTNGLLSDSEKSPYRELSVIRRDDDDDVLSDINLNREKLSLPKPVLSNTNMNTFTATVTIEGNENSRGDLGVASNPRFSPPPTYAEFLRASREELDRGREEAAYFLPSVGPSYR